MSSSGLSHKNLFAPLLVFQTECQSWALCVSLCSYLVFFNLLPLSAFCRSLIHLVHFNLCALSISPRFCLSALFLFLSVFMPSLSPPPLVFVSISFYSSLFLPLSPLFPSIINVVFSVSRSTFNFLQPTFFFFSCSLLPDATHYYSNLPVPLSSSTLSCLASDKGEYEIYTYHTQVDWREGLWHRQIIERIQHVIQVIFLGRETNNKRRRKKKKNIRTHEFYLLVLLMSRVMCQS